MPRSLARRPATTADLDWMFHIRRVTIAPYVEQTYGLWDDATQRLYNATSLS